MTNSIRLDDSASLQCDDEALKLRLGAVWPSLPERFGVTAGHGVIGGGMQGRRNRRLREARGGGDSPRESEPA